MVGTSASTVAAFAEEAYGACLTLVYLRAMPLMVRNDLHMTFMARGGLWGGKSAAKWSQAEGQARRVFYGKLISIRQEAFALASFDAITNADNPAPYQPEGLILNPWSCPTASSLKGWSFCAMARCRTSLGRMPTTARQASKPAPP